MGTLEVEQGASAAGYRILLSSIPPETQYAEDSFNDLSHRRIDGLIMVPSFIYQSAEAQKTLANLLERHVPVIGIMAEHSGADYNLDRVISDYRSATIEVMIYLLSLQHR
jgi:DNA-binding LacI/PurR family transcriptional regulator